MYAAQTSRSLTSSEACPGENDGSATSLNGLDSVYSRAVARPNLSSTVVMCASLRVGCARRRTGALPCKAPSPAQRTHRHQAMENRAHLRRRKRFVPLRALLLECHRHLDLAAEESTGHRPRSTAVDWSNRCECNVGLIGDDYRTGVGCRFDCDATEGRLSKQS